MKGGSKAERRRNRAGGRPAAQGIRREENGRASRRAADRRERVEMTEAEAKSVAVEARMRQTGLPEDLAGANVLNGPNAGTVHGVMALKQEITRDQFDAAEWYLGRRLAWLRAIRCPGHFADVDPDRPKSGDPEAEAEWVRHVIGVWNEIRGILQETCTKLRRPVDAALTVVLVKQQPMPEMIEDLRACLDVIHSRFLAGQRHAA